ncbi:hypothetical protein G6O69_06245 [Pseudenhygromyxa sp. WMMC2535]|uniref:hypothetical protein n=1 Tax=Pseudenhygromyxa sp. WMMC2535 TaxID=2712867 RepID=UPI001551ED89|nr:hypothetical protein [Pseudenhygromyxa sp. WMMC2535]NVB37424.1 hypothetical protein [Pseudenhygromyxa sp. WMMC2535]
MAGQLKRAVAHARAASDDDERPLVGLDALPRTRAYLESLPLGLDGYPRLWAKSAIVRHIQNNSQVRIVGLPASLQDWLELPTDKLWIPQAHTLALILALVEAQGYPAHSEAERRWIRTAASDLFSSPLYALLMRAVSVRLLLQGANLRWSAFFRGSTLAAEVYGEEAELFLEAAVGLFDHNLANIFAEVTSAAMDFSTPCSPGRRVELIDCAPGRVHYRVSW